MKPQRLHFFVTPLTSGHFFTIDDLFRERNLEQNAVVHKGPVAARLFPLCNEKVGRERVAETIVKRVELNVTQTSKVTVPFLIERKFTRQMLLYF